MKLAIYGAGSLGTILGAYMTQCGLDVDLINHNAAHIAGLKEKGARIIGTVDMTVPVKALLPDEMSRSYDIIFLLTKQLDNPKVVAGLLPYLEPDGVVCTLQNGLPEPAIAGVIGEHRTFGCSVAWGATLIGGGVCELTSAPDSISFGLGAFSSAADPGKLTAIRTALEAMGTVEVEDNFMGARWSKLMVNCAFSGMSAVLGGTFGEVAANRQSRRCIQRLFKECIDVARQAGIRPEPIQGKDIGRIMDYRSKIKQAIVFEAIPLIIRKHRRLKASMLQDLEKGRKTEVDSINGIVCDFGRQHHVPTPYNHRVVAIIHAIEDGQYAPGFDNLSRFDELGGD